MASSSGYNPLLRGSSNDSRAHSPMPGSAFHGLKDKSVEDLRKLLTDKEAYEKFLHSVDEIRQLDTLGNDLRKSNIMLARQNLAKDGQMAELKNQCTIIRTTELASAREKFEEARKHESEILCRESPVALLEKLQEAAMKADEESEKLHRRFVNGEMEISEFVQKYRQERILYHKRSLTRLAGIASFSHQT